ncbi:MAG: hypothetical protein FWB77_00640 [Treponema sp.]|nr:hypothetical protein [Treponema sp.]
MKKRIIYLALAISIFCFYACEIKIPTAVEITGSPKLTLTANYDVSDLLSGIFDDMFAGFNEDEESPVKIYDCVHNSITTKTLLVYVEVLKQNFNMSSEYTTPELDDIFDLIDNQFPGGIPFDNDDLGFDIDGFPQFNTSGDESFDMPSLNFQDLLGEDFPFKLDSAGIKTKLYIYGHPIASVLSITINDEEKANNNTVPNWSDINNEANTYNSNVLPAGGSELSLPISDGLEDFSISVEISSDATLTKQMLTANEDINVVLAIMIPLKLVSAGTGSYTLIDLSEEDDDEDGVPNDILGRERGGSLAELGDMEVHIEKIKMILTINPLPFKNAEIKITNGNSGDLNYINFPAIQFGSNTITVDFNSTEMNAIIEKWPFAPKIEVLFKNNAEISIPRTLVLKKLEVETKVKVTAPLALTGLGL